MEKNEAMLIANFTGTIYSEWNDIIISILKDQVTDKRSLESKKIQISDRKDKKCSPMQGAISTQVSKYLFALGIPVRKVALCVSLAFLQSVRN